MKEEMIFKGTRPVTKEQYNVGDMAQPVMLVEPVRRYEPVDVLEPVQPAGDPARNYYGDYRPNPYRSDPYRSDPYRIDPIRYGFDENAFYCRQHYTGQRLLDCLAGRRYY